jgi:hypothetical protein
MRKKINVVFCNEGTFVPIRSGGDYFKCNFLKFLNKYVNLTVINCTRTYAKDCENTRKLGLKIIHIPPFKFYADIIYLNSLFRNAQIVMFNDAINVLQIGSKLKKMNPGIKIGYEAHNIDYALFTELNYPPKMILRQKQIERQALSESDFIFVRSARDKAILSALDEKFGNRIIVGKSGISDYEIKNLYDSKRWYKKILFLGHLNYAPNRKAVEHIIYRIAPKVYKFDPTIEFLIWGVGLNNILLPQGVNVKINGYTEDLNAIMTDIDLALCPITEGSGTRIKILGYMARGIPTITTTKGIEGLEDEIKGAVIVEDDIDRYSKLIIDIFKKKSKERLGVMSRKGISYLRNHRAWSKLIKRYVKALEVL